MLVVDHRLNGSGQVPVDTHRPRLRLGRRGRRVGVGRERGVVNAELAVAGRELDGAEGARLRIERLLGCGASPRVLLAREEVRPGRLPSGVLELDGRERGPAHPLPRLDVLTMNSERTGVEVGLRGEALPRSIREHVADRGRGAGEIAEPGLLSAGAVARELRRGRRAPLETSGAGHADTEALQ